MVRHRQNVPPVRIRAIAAMGDFLPRPRARTRRTRCKSWPAANAPTANRRRVALPVTRLLESRTLSVHDALPQAGAIRWLNRVVWQYWLLVNQKSAIDNPRFPSGVRHRLDIGNWER